MDPLFKNASVNSSESESEDSQPNVTSGALFQSPQLNSKERRILSSQSSGNVSNSQDGDSEELREIVKNNLEKHELQLLALFEDMQVEKTSRESEMTDLIVAMEKQTSVQEENNSSVNSATQ